MIKIAITNYLRHLSEQARGMHAGWRGRCNSCCKRRRIQSFCAACTPAGLRGCDACTDEWTDVDAGSAFSSEYDTERHKMITLHAFVYLAVSGLTCIAACCIIIHAAGRTQEMTAQP